MAGLGTTVALIKSMGKPDPTVIEQSVSDWLDDHPEATTTVQDGSITKAKLDTNLQETVDDVSDLKNEINNTFQNVGLKSQVHYGNVSSTLTWNNLNANYQHIVIPCVAGDNVVISGQARYICVSEYTEPVNGASVNPVDSVVSVVDNSTKTFTAAANAKYLVIMTVYVGTVYTLTSVTVNGISVINPLTKTLSELNTRLNGKVNISQGVSHAGKALIVGQDGNVTTGDVGVSVDATLSIAGKAADAKAAGDAITALGGRVDVLDKNVGLKSPAYNGNISSSLTWNNINNNYQHIVIPCKPNDTVVFIGSARFVFVSEYAKPVLDASVNSLDSTVNVVSSTVTKTAPTSTKYLVVMVVYGGNVYTCDIKINGISVINPVAKTLSELKADADNLRSDFNSAEQIIVANQKNIGNTAAWLNGESLKYLYSPFENGTWKYSASTGTATEKIVYGGFVRSSDYIYLPDGTTILQKTSGVQIRLIKVDTAYIVSGKITTEYNEPYVLEAGYYVFDIQTTDIAHINDYYSITIPTARFPDQPTVNWLAMGDSITEGWYSYFDETATSGANYSVDTKNCWANKVAVYNRWNLTNMGAGGTGFIHNSGTDPQGTGAYKGLTMDFTPYDLVTISYGINDWKGNQYPLGSVESAKGTYVDGVYTPPVDVAGAIKTLIEGIYASNQNCKVVLITPIQAAGYYSTVSGRHTYENSPRMSLSYEYNNTGTLLEFAGMMKSIAEYYGIEYIDMTLGSEVNFLNALNALPDGIHPSLITHELLARELRKKIHQ